MYFSRHGAISASTVAPSIYATYAREWYAPTTFPSPKAAISAKLSLSASHVTLQLLKRLPHILYVFLFCWLFSSSFHFLWVVLLTLFKCHSGILRWSSI